MKIKHKYIRNRHYWRKNWQRIRVTQHPFETFDPWDSQYYAYSTEDQVKRNFEGITRDARRLENGSHSIAFAKNASSEYRRMLNKKRKALERNIMSRIRNGEYELEMPKFKNDAAWNYW